VFIGKPAFEDICRQYVIRQNKENALPFSATAFGSWWGTDASTKQQADVDVIAENKQQGKILLCECKWKSEPADLGDVKKLLDKPRLLAGYSVYHFMFFSKSGFTDAALGLEKESPLLRIVTLDMLYA